MLVLTNRVVITGIGAITPIGTGKDAFWDGLMAGKNGIGKITRFDAAEYAAQIAGEVKDFDPTDYIDKKESKRMDRYTQFAIAASKMAFEDAKIDLEAENRERIGTFVGTGIGGIETMHEQYKKLFDKGPSRISPFFIPMMIGNMAAGQISITLGLRGPSSCVVTACATGSNCIGDAFRVIQRGDADVMVAGGTEASISQAAVAGFCSMKALCMDHNEDPEHASRPFDKNRAVLSWVRALALSSLRALRMQKSAARISMLRLLAMAPTRMPTISLLRHRMAKCRPSACSLLSTMQG